MKNLQIGVFIIIVASIILISGCSSTNLPPNPPSPGQTGSGNNVGQASGVFVQYASPTFSLAPSVFYFENDTTHSMYHSSPLSINITSTDQLVYDTAYYAINSDSSTSTWVPVTLVGSRVGSSHWLSRVTGAITVSSNDYASLTASQLYTLTVFNDSLIIYSCSFVNSSWDCSNNEWQLGTFGINIVNKMSCQFNSGCISGVTCVPNNSTDNIVGDPNQNSTCINRVFKKPLVCSIPSCLDTGTTTCISTNSFASGNQKICDEGKLVTQGQYCNGSCYVPNSINCYSVGNISPDGAHICASNNTWNSLPGIPVKPGAYGR